MLIQKQQHNTVRCGLTASPTHVKPFVTSPEIPILRVQCTIRIHCLLTALRNVHQSTPIYCKLPPQVPRQPYQSALLTVKISRGLQVCDCYHNCCPGWPTREHHCVIKSHKILVLCVQHLDFGCTSYRRLVPRHPFKQHRP